MASSAKEDYLKAIYELEEKVGIARTTPLANKLGVRAATVTEMIQRLSKEKPSTVTYKHHQGVRLTSAGRKQAMGIVRRHRLLETLLHRTLGMRWDQIHEEAEVLEHHISPRMTDAIDRHLEFPKFDPHGEPIPDANGNMAPQPQLSLSEIDAGARFTITRVNPVSGEFLTHLESMAIGIGTCGRMVSKEAMDGSLTIEIDTGNGAPRISLTRHVTDRIYVEAT